jgi:hypothetical protein
LTWNPPLRPFFGHFIEGPIIDDGKQPSWLNGLASLFTPPDPPVDHAQPEHIVVAYPRNDTAPLSLYSIILPKHFKQSAERIEQLLTILSYRKSPMSFEIIASADTIALQWVCSELDAGFVQIQIQAFFPECTVREAEADKVLAIFDTELPLYTVDFGLEEEFMRPLSQLQSSAHDPYMALFGILSRLNIDQYILIQVLFSGTHNAWADSILTAVHDDSGKQSFFFDAPEMPQLAREKVARPLFGVTVRAMTFADTVVEAGLLLQQVATAIVHASKSVSNALLPLSNSNYTIEERLSDIALRTTHRVGMLLNSRELATLVHFPAVQSTKLLGAVRTTKQASTSLTNPNYVLGINEHQGQIQEVGISVAQRLRHMHIMGATGTGKSTLLQNLMMQDIHAGMGLMCLDPHGDLIDELLQYIPKERIEDVVLIDPTDADFPIALNILVAHSDIERELLASDLVAMFRRFSTSWGDQMNSVFANAVLAFMYNTKQYHLGDVRRFLIEAPYRATVLSTVTDPDIVYYWSHEFPIVKSASIGPILTRLDTFLRPKVIRQMVCQTKSLDFARLMDTNKIVLVKLSLGLLGAENSYLLGAFIVSKLQQTAMARQAQGIQERIPFFCYIDEFQHFVTPSMATILSGARKYALGLILSHQDMQQVAKNDTEIAGSVLANAGTRVYFRLGDTDAKRIEDGFSSFTASDLQNLSTGEAIARVNTTDQDFNLAVIPYASNKETNYTAEIRAHSRKHNTVHIDPPNQTLKTMADVPKPPLPISSSIKPVSLEEEPAIAPKEQIREHRYLQTFVKAMAEAQGYIAQLEVPTPDGTGLVDVLLMKGDETIAVEISVTTSPEWELHNIEKCLAAGYSKVVVCTTDSSKLHHIKARIASFLTTEEQAKITVINSNNLQSLFKSDHQAPPTETLVKGYRVKVKYEPNATRQDLLQSVINATRKR